MPAQTTPPPRPRRGGAIQNTSGLGFTPEGEPMPSADLIPIVKQTSNTLLLSFSLGKDSLAMWLYLRDKGFKIIPYFLHFVPGLSYVEKALDYYERFFDCEILRYPHPLFYNMVRTWAFQEIHAISTVMSFDMLRDYDLAMVDDLIVSLFKLAPPPFCAIGMRSGDNLERYRLIRQQGSLGVLRRRYYYAVWDWNVEQVSRIIIEAGCKLPLDYKYWGRTITAYSHQYMQHMSAAFPDDYARILAWFPLLEADRFRYEQMRHHEAQDQD